eukprot:CAMPEP_0172458520 /NCGR_PEP_ID=MMETSP1065-20121228/27949_1 /TAXON_ID=265537 /ORGANISM="Amphiprora paludosa, Strain CCMP125" /LENGTH=80 /DNA_ID=CAMNT_0013212815 /DNA_START=62 /DNA_END=301 /DNA_ORIENTATION=-
MTPERIEQLDQLGLEWELRGPTSLSGGGGATKGTSLSSQSSAESHNTSSGAEKVYHIDPEDALPIQPGAGRVFSCVRGIR